MKTHGPKKNVNVKNIVGASLMFLVIIGLAIYGVYYNNLAKKQQADMENQYQRAFLDMVEYVNDAQQYLLKALATGTPATTSMMLDEAWRSTSQAESCLALLPIDQQLISKVSNYLVQLGDVSYAWSTQAVKGTGLTEEQYDTLVELYGYAQDLSGGLEALAMEMKSQSYTWDEVRLHSGSLMGDQELAERYSSLSSLSDPFEDYPTLVYDGPFSEHMSNLQPKGLSGSEMTADEGLAKVEKMLGQLSGFAQYTPRVKLSGENSYKNIDTFSYTVTFDEDAAYLAYVDITKKGGLLYSMMFYRECGEANLNPEQAVEAGRSFLSAIGLKNMKSSYYYTEGNYVTVNYSYYQNDILYYPDMVKVKIALDTGDAVGFEGHGYISYHHERETEAAKITREQAQQALNPRLKVMSSQEVVIPNDYGGEVHAYEFQCTTLGRNFLIYVDAATGEETEVLILIEDGNGTLTA